MARMNVTVNTHQLPAENFEPKANRQVQLAPDVAITFSNGSSSPGKTDLLVTIFDLPGTVVFKRLEATMKSADEPLRSFDMIHVYTFKEKPGNKTIPQSRVMEEHFSGLPEEFRTMSPRREVNGFYFVFNTPSIELNEHFTFIVTGTAVYKKKTIHFKKLLKASRIDNGVYIWGGADEEL